ncbi:low temperature requirement protein A [soil metagenome]
MVRATRPQGATFIELFFDLVFVFAVTQVTAVLEEHLTAVGLVQAVLVFWLVWWAWTQFTWTLNAANTEHSGIELLTMAAVAAAFFMALTVPDPYETTGGWFAASYILVRLIGIAGQWWVSAGDAAWRGAIRPWAILSFGGLAAVALAAALPPGPRTVLFAAAVGLDLFSAWRAGSGEWRLYPEHFAERHGLFVIIALGESLIAAGINAGELEDTGTLLAVTVPAVVAACALWWTYFSRAKDALEEAMHWTPSRYRGRFARDVFSFLHFPIIGGVIGFAVAVVEAVHHPGDHLEPAAALALIIGVALFVGCTGLALLRARAEVPLVRAIGIVVLLASYPLLVTVSAATALTYVALVLVVVAAVDTVRSGR